MDNVNNWHIFKAVCERTQNRLLSFLNKESDQLEEVSLVYFDSSAYLKLTLE